MLIFAEGGKPKDPEKDPRRERINNKLKWMGINGKERKEAKRGT
jgi:hypothetical protein